MPVPGGGHARRRPVRGDRRVSPSPSPTTSASSTSPRWFACRRPASPSSRTCEARRTGAAASYSISPLVRRRDRDVTGRHRRIRPAARRPVHGARAVGVRPPGRPPCIRRSPRDADADDHRRVLGDRLRAESARRVRRRRRVVADPHLERGPRRCATSTSSSTSTVAPRRRPRRTTAATVPATPATQPAEDMEPTRGRHPGGRRPRARGARARARGARSPRGARGGHAHRLTIHPAVAAAHPAVAATPSAGREASPRRRGASQRNHPRMCHPPCLPSRATTLIGLVELVDRLISGSRR